jgi:hypothetical protein
MEMNLILNTFIFASFLLTAYFTFLFACRHGSSWPLSLLAGALTAFTPLMIHRAAHGHLNMLPMWWISLSLLAFDFACHSRRFGSVLALVFCLYAALLTDFQYMMWIPMVLVPYALGQILSPRFRSDRGRRYSLLARLGLAILIFACLVLLYPVRQLLQVAPAGYPQASLETAHHYSLPVSSFFQYKQDYFTIGLLIVPVTIVVWVLGRARKGSVLWLVVASASLLLALGPYLSLEPYSETLRIPLPYLVLHRLLRGQYRVPARFAIPAVFCLSIFIALEGQAVLDRLRIAQPFRFGLVGGILFLMIIDYGLLRPFPISLPKEYATYREIAKDSRDVTLLEVPLGIDTGYAMFGHGKELIYYQPIHKKRTPSGALSRMSMIIIDYYRPFNLLNAVAGRSSLDPATAADELTRLIEEWNIGYVLIHRDMLNQEELQQLPSFFAAHPSLCFWQAEEDLLAYRVRPVEGCPPMEGPVRVDVGLPEDVAYVGTGWYLPEIIGGVTGRWAGGIQTATLRLDLTPQTYCLSFCAWAYPPDQVVILEVNEEDIAVFPMPETWTVYTTTIPGTVIQAGEPTQIRFNHTALLSPYERTQEESPDQRALGAAYDWVVIEPCAQ